MSNLDVLSISTEIDLLAHQTFVEISTTNAFVEVLSQSQIDINITGVVVSRIEVEAVSDGVINLLLPTVPLQLLGVYNNGLLLHASEYSIAADIVSVHGVVTGDIITINYY